MRRRLVEAGRVIVESGGPDALSMRKVAAEVGVAPTAIYWHVGGRDDLLSAVLDSMIADLPHPVPRGRTPRDRVASLARAMRDQALATTHTQQLARQLGRSAELFLPGQVALARELSAAGLRGDDAAQAVRAVLFLVGGFVLLEDNYRTAQPGSGRIQDLWTAVDDPGIDDDLRQAMSRATTPDTLFGYTVDRLLASVLP
jgi:TetR/AcrR family tetracycline transcriptional repressor